MTTTMTATATAKRGVVLFGHGARDPRWADPFRRLRDLAAARLPNAIVVLAFLEMMEPDLDAAADRLVADGCTLLSIVPIFFGQGAHLRRDLPERVAALRARLPQLAIDVVEAAGEDAAVLDAVADYCVRVVTPSSADVSSG